MGIEKGDASNGLNEEYDAVDDLHVQVETPDQTSVVSRASSMVSGSRQSQVTSLIRQLQEEQDARKRLEKEMKDLKVISKEIKKKLVTK